MEELNVQLGFKNLLNKFGKTDEHGNKPVFNPLKAAMIKIMENKKMSFADMF